MIYAYTKVSTPYTTIQMALPYEMDSENQCTELCTLEGVTYVSVPDSVTLPDQPAELTITEATITPELRDQIKAASPHCRLITERMEMRILSKYSLSDEQYFARIAGRVHVCARRAGRVAGLWRLC